MRSAFVCTLIVFLSAYSSALSQPGPLAGQQSSKAVNASRVGGLRFQKGINANKIGGPKIHNYMLAAPSKMAKPEDLEFLRDRSDSVANKSCCSLDAGLHLARRRLSLRAVRPRTLNCIDSLSEMASADPLIPFEGRPEEIINNSLLWKDPRSKCFVDDAKVRLKIFKLATAWRLKNAVATRSLLSQIKTSL